MELNECAEPLAIDIAFWIERLVDPTCPFEEHGQLAIELSSKLRALAVVLLLTRGDHVGYAHNLIRSGRVWRTFLQRAVDEQSLAHHHYCSGRYQPLADAIAASDFKLARQIVSLSPAGWRQGCEYQDDFCIGRLLGLFLMPPVREQVETINSFFSEYLEHGPSPRIDLANALLSQDSEQFHIALISLVELRTTEIASRKRDGEVDEPVAVANRFVMCEALAWLRLAELARIDTQREYAMCPSLARVPVSIPLPEATDPLMDDWLR